MSIADKITRLTTARDDIRTALEDKGIDASEHGFEDFADDISDISSGGNPNYIETIEGTLANPFANVDPSFFIQGENPVIEPTDIFNHYTVYIQIKDDQDDDLLEEAFIVSYGICINNFTQDKDLYAAVIDGGGYSYSAEKCSAITMTWIGESQASLSIAEGHLIVEGNEVTIDDTWTTTLTIIHHPMTGALAPAESETFGGNS